MAKLRLGVWMVGLGAAAVLLLGDVTWSEEPAEAVMTVVRVTAGALAAYLCVATILAIRVPRLAPRFVRRLVATAVGTGLLVAPMTASAQTRDPAPMEAPVLRRVPEAEPAPLSAGPQPHDERRPAENAAGETVTIERGDHLWSVAARTLGERLGRAATDAEVAPYWAALIEANRDRLATPDPDLVFPGQEFRLPS